MMMMRGKIHGRDCSSTSYRRALGVFTSLKTEAIKYPLSLYKDL